MTVKISVFAVVLIVTCVCASIYPPLPPPHTLTMSLPYMANYPDDCPCFNEFKKSVYILNQALANIIANGRSAYDYYTLYNDQPGLQLTINEKKDIFEKSLNYFENKLAKYREALINFKTLLEYKDPVLSMDDNILIDNDLL